MLLFLLIPLLSCDGRHIVAAESGYYADSTYRIEKLVNSVQELYVNDANIVLAYGDHTEVFRVVAMHRHSDSLYHFTLIHPLYGTTIPAILTFTSSGKGSPTGMELVIIMEKILFIRSHV